MIGRLPRGVSLSLVLSLAVMMVVPATAAAVPPATSLLLSPAVPDGSNGWWRTPPEAFASVDQDAIVHYDWGTGETTIGVAPGSPQSLGFAPEGLVTLTAYAVNAAEETGTAAGRTLGTDSMPPDQPAGLVVVPADGQLSLSWDPAPDSTSGLAYYTVYRNLSGPPFSVGDAFAAVTETSCVDDPGPGFWYYAVRATDRAGNDSLMSDAARASADVVPPSVPTGLQAWRNGRGFIRVSWEGSSDSGSGVAFYTIGRSTGGADPVVVGTVSDAVTFFDDTDPEAYAGDEVAYLVSATDRVGNESGAAGPADTGTDLVAPPKPEAPVVHAIPDLDGMFHELGTDASAEWTERSDAGSGVLRYELLTGPDPDAPTLSRYFPAPGRAYLRSTALRSDDFFRIRVEDRAGNISEMSDPVLHRALTVDRIEGPNRIQTSLAVGRAGFPTADAVVFASAYSFPDALAASGLAGALDAPVVLVGPGPLPAETLAALDSMGAEDGWVVGGPPAVSDATFASIASALSGETTRVAGPDRYRTAAAVASALHSITGTPPRAYVVSGVSFPDALSVGPAAYVEAAPVLFANPTGIPQVTLDALAWSGAMQTVIAGGPSAVWGGVESRVAAPFRVQGADRYATSKAFADWAVGEGILTRGRPVLATGADFPDGLSAAPLAGVRHSPVLLVRRYSLGSAASFLGADLGGPDNVSAIGSDRVIDYRVMQDAWKLFALPAD